MDEEAKVRAMAGFHSPAGADEALEAIAPGFVVAVDVTLGEMAPVVELVTVLLVRKLVGNVHVVWKEHTNDAVSAGLEGGQLAGLLEVFADKFGPGHQSRVKPHASVPIDVAGVPLSLLWGDAGSAGVAVWWKESVNPKFVVKS